jgi:predicted acyltransferase
MNRDEPRTLAIDVMRGATLALMIVVNMSISEAKSYAQLLHANWHGLTLTDLVFPSFLFVMGAAMSITLPRYQALGAVAMWRKLAIRTLLIFLFGFALYWFPFFQADAAGGWSLRPLSELRVMGVLQRIALSYALAALVLQWAGPRGAVVYALLALLANWWVLASFGDYTLAGNAALALDRWALGEAHLYRGEGTAFDPEGLLGTVPASVNVLAGYAAGSMLRQRGRSRQAVAALWLAALACAAIALAWSSVMPINKKLWTSSYVLAGAAVDLAVLAMLVAVIDLAGLRRWAGFFEVFGKNTLFLYLLAELAMSVLWLVPVGGQTAFEWVHATAFEPWAGSKPGSLLFALLFMLACWGVGRAMDRRGLYVKL